MIVMIIMNDDNNNDDNDNNNNDIVTIGAGDVVAACGEAVILKVVCSLSCEGAKRCGTLASASGE